VKAPRVGIGYDCHPFAGGRPLVLGGLTIPSRRGLAGHSDADVLTHAVIDALLGAIAGGDIGRLFPDTEEAYRDVSSMDLLTRAVDRVRAQGYRVGNVDAVVIAEEPRIAPHADAIRATLATTLGVEAGHVSVKGKTNEKMGAFGRGEGIASQAVVLLLPDGE